MTRPSTLRPLALAALVLLPATAAEALHVAPRGTRTGDSVAETGLRVAQGGCSAAAREAAQQSGGQVLSVQTANRGGRTVCVVTVLIPAQDGNRPRRQTITIEQ
ncbi:hypothetical protein [Aureimonas jatrophae]|uniref:Uncharacterized protein n=1 Tax=Aureimonas jatrophae TaxID=1166073 RepID=A0A1H0CQL8_9HYPH|nr:hypothetical protein [Aureimonas jatrophae]MBB3949341.1 hypothetical protein [Aureimonas jatrophae]SDN60184.1 hypothetical protein SAMN05192530_101418 [Aureimonas jatrophae]